MQTATIVSEDRFLLYKHLKSMRALSEQLEDSLQELVDARLSLMSAFQHCMNPEVQKVIDESNALGAKLEAMYLKNEQHIRYVEGLLHESPTNGSE
jgi:hypothetical protein